MKKIFVLIACLALVMFTAGAVSAEEETPTVNAGSDETLVTYNVASVYTLIIPGTFTFGSTEEYLPIELMTMSSKLGENQRINITVNSSQFSENQPDGNNGHGLWTLISTNSKGAESKLYYHIHTYENVPIKNGSSVFTATGQDVVNKLNTIGTDNLSIKKNIHFKLNDTDPHVSGSFTDRLLFTIKLEDVS